MGSNVRPIIVHIVNTLEGGGTERSLVNMLSNWRHDIFDHRVVTLRSPGSLVTQLPSQVACYSIGTTGRSRTAWLKLAGILRNWRATIVHARNTSCWADATLASLLVPKSQLILGFHGLESAEPFSGRINFLTKFALRSGATFAAVSKSGQEKLKQELNVPLQKTTVIHNGVDRAQFRPPSLQQKQYARTKLGLNQGELVVGCVGSLTPVKNHQLLLAAFADIIKGGYRAKLLIVGDGPLRKKLTDTIRQLGINQQVHLCGEESLVISCLHAMDVFVCSSDSECLSNSLLEALSAGLPIISTDVGDHAWALSNGQCGMVVPTGNAEALTAAIARVFSNATYRMNLGNQAFTRAADFDIAATTTSYEQFYDSLTPRRVDTPPRRLEKRLIVPSDKGPVINQPRAKSAYL